MSIINFIFGDKNIDLKRYSQKSGYSHYTVNQPLSDQHLNLIVDLNFNPNLESELIDVSQNVKHLKNIEIIKPEAPQAYNTMIDKLNAAEITGTILNLGVFMIPILNLVIPHFCLNIFLKFWKNTPDEPPMIGRTMFFIKLY